MRLLLCCVVVASLLRGHGNETVIPFGDVVVHGIAHVKFDFVCPDRLCDCRVGLS